jgi:2,4-dienoyl-CoA reductase-like NADH-dependent reductase (Old Yellow Enzyme family)/thioredoxin reductase
MSGHNLTAEGHFTPETQMQYEILAKGGAGAVVIGETLVHSKTGNNHGRVLRLDDPEALPGLHKCTDAIHRYGALASIELVHPGRRADPRYNEQGKTYGPSAGYCHYGDGEHAVTELDEKLIAEIVEAFGDAAEMAMLAGCDFVTVHAGHGWLLNQFLSPANNQRTDRFGGSVFNRARISLMVADNIRDKCGPAFPIDFRVSGDDFMEGGADQETVIEFAKLLAPHIDMLHVSATSFHNRRASIRMFPSMFHPRGVNSFLAAELKKHVGIPVVTVGGFNDPAHMEELIESGRADAIALGRALLADPFLPEKARLGLEDDITFCTRCNNCVSVGFVPYVKYNVGVSHCSVNPWHGLAPEFLNRRKPAKKVKVAVVGGGPAGMMAALGASDQGHDAILFEKTEALGGMLKFAAFPEFKKDISRFIETISKRIEKRDNIQVMLGCEASPEEIKKLGIDKLIVAIGAKPIELAPGHSDPKVVSVIDLRNPGVEIGERVVIVGAGQAGIEEGIALAGQAKKVAILERTSSIASDAAYIHYLALVDRIEKLDSLEILAGASYLGACGEGAIAASNEGERTIPADTIIIAAGVAPLSEEASKFEGCAPLVSIVGDCRKAGKMSEAVLSGYFAGFNALGLD